MKSIKLLLSAGLLTYCTLVSAQLKLEDRLSLNGYMDMIYLNSESPTAGNLSYISTYRVNLLPQFIITPKLKVTLLLEGADLFALDESDQIEEPGIMEWSYLTYSYNDRLKLRAGTFAIPFGIYNESFYATPTQLTSLLPGSVYFQHEYGTGKEEISQFLFPRNPSGLMLFGTALSFKKHLLKYYVYYTNESLGSSATGLGKYVGGRLLYETATSDLLKVGASYNTYLFLKKEVNRTLGFDVQLRVKNLQFFTELVLPQIGQRDTLQLPVYNKYYEGISTYAQLGYTIKDLVTPYVRYEFYDGNKHIKDGEYATVLGGFNIAFHPQVILKAEAYAAQVRHVTDLNLKSTFYLATLAVAF